MSKPRSIIFPAINRTFGDAQNVFTIKKIDIVKVVDILKGIADSFNMLRLAELLAKLPRG